MAIETEISQSTDVMVDIETMGRRPYCPILSIGAVRFDTDPNRFLVADPEADLFYQPIRLASCLDVGLKVDADTLIWWTQQDDKARSVLNDPSAVDLPIALDAFTDWLNSRPDRLWGNSARFDFGILEAAYVACGKEVPWQFWRERCYRTIKNEPYAEKVQLVRQGTYHNALDDAMSQADHLKRIFAVRDNVTTQKGN